MSASKKPNGEAEILIVEDSPTQAEQLRYLLERHDYAVTAAQDGAQALALVGEHRPTLVITDIVMPEMDGYELCRRIKVDEGSQNVPVILLTNLANPEDVLEGLACGADSFITKPYSEEYLLLRVEQILANLRLRRDERVRVGVEIIFAGKRRFITADQQQMLTLLLSTYEAAVHRNAELNQAQEELGLLNEHLEDLVEERTAALQQSEKRFRALIENSADTISLVGADGTVLYNSPSYRRMLGYTPEGRVGRNSFELVHPGDREHLLRIFAGILERPGQVVVPPSRVRHAGGSWHWIEGVANNLLAEPAVQAIVVNFRDITERKRAEEALRESEHLLRMVADNIPALVSYIDQAHRYRFVNQRYAENFRKPVADMIGKPYRDVVGEAYYQATLNNVNAAFSGQRVSYETTIDFPEIGTRWLAVSYTPDVDELGHVQGIFIAAYDITERKQAEEALRESEARFSTVFHTSPIGISITRLVDGQYIDVNEAFLDLFGYAREEALSQTSLQLQTWAFPEDRDKVVKTLREQGQVRGMEAQLRRKTGEIRTGLFSADVMDIAGESYILVLLQDITERKQAEAQLAEQLDELRRWHAATLGRETRILELKREVNELLAQAGQPPRYPSAEVGDQ